MRANGVAHADDVMPFRDTAAQATAPAKDSAFAAKLPASAKTGLPPAKLSSVAIGSADGRAPASTAGERAVPETVFHRKGTATATTFRPSYWYYDAEAEAPKSRRREPRAKLLRKSI